MTVRLSCGPAFKTDTFLFWDRLRGLTNTPEKSQSMSTLSPLHPQLKVTTKSGKDPEMLETVPWSDQSRCEILSGNHDVILDKEERDHPAV